jgi:hypothetical protein
MGKIKFLSLVYIGEEGGTTTLTHFSYICLYIYIFFIIIKWLQIIILHHHENVFRVHMGIEIIKKKFHPLYILCACFERKIC